MSNIQSRMKIIYDNIEKGKLRSINEEDQNTIALWAIVFSIVYEANHPEWAFTTFDGRIKIKERLAPTSDWHVWVAGYEGRTDWSNHFGLQAYLLAREVGTLQWHNVHMQGNHRIGIQVTSWPFSNLFFMTCFKSPEIVNWPRTVEIDNGASLIYPKRSPNLDVSRSINILEADKISRIILQIRESDSRRIWGAGPAPITPEKDQDPK
ncbi:hypothetical protein P7L74_00460 (plasmid) [Tistrella mobilis]|uniref:hypothetical protein n=1 Tax=Tistrella mobilis TaxID=171437 RepID=UPI0035577098